MLRPTIVAFIIIITIATLAVIFRKRNRWVGLLHGVAFQMAIVIPVAIAQLTGFVWKSWSIDPLEALQVFPL